MIYFKDLDRSKLSKMMQQYYDIKKDNLDTILMFRLGDFYEMFFDDAVKASEILNLVLTGRDCGLQERAPMCGVPFHSCDGYIARLVQSGCKVAICEQMEDPALAKDIVERSIVRIVTPGTVIEDTMLEEGTNNYLCSVSYINGDFGMAISDISCGSVKTVKIEGQNKENRLICELSRFSPKEVLIDLSTLSLFKNLNSVLTQRISCAITPIPTENYLIGLNASNIIKHFKNGDISTIGLAVNTPEVAALDVLIKYLGDNGMSGLNNIDTVSPYDEKQFMRLDINAIRNLEIFETMRSKNRRGSLLWVVDKTKTAMGKRRLLSFFEQPLLSITQIEKRQNAVEELYNDVILRGDLTELLIGMNDVERLLTRVVYGSATCKELNAVAATAAKFAPIKQRISGCKCEYLRKIYDAIDPLEDIITLITSAIEEKPPLTIREGGMIKKGYNEELDLLRGSVNGDATVLAKIEEQEKEKTGIKTLKVKYNRVFGYYIEVSKSFIDKVPADYIRKQTLTNCERYITEELKLVEDRILGAKEKAIALEYRIFEEIRKTVATNFERLKITGNAIALLDAFLSLAKVAGDNRYVRPTLNNKGVISIKDGRHPVVEAISKEPFVANDTLLDNGDNRCAIITGPNMAGKSTYMRQVAIISLLTQIGSFVPAASADMCIVDAIFTRVGASDDLAMGQSTFMVEMSEVADIIKYATKNSLIILDEIGRGTSTFDGMSIARAVLEYITDAKKIGAKTLFATHYHELTVLENVYDGVKNYNIAVKKRGDDITFLRRIVRGAADESYGIEVAKLSGIPHTVTDRAKEILNDTLDGKEVPIEHISSGLSDDGQMSLFSQNNEIVDTLKNIDVNTLTPIEALKTLYELSDKAKQ